MLQSYLRALRQIGDPTFRSVLRRALLGTIALYAAMLAAAWYALGLLPLFGIEWLDTIIEFLTGFGVIVLMVLLFPAVASLFIGIFLDDIAEAVEARWYPAERRGRPLPFWRALAVALRFFALVLLLNIAVLPLYVLAIWFPPLNLVLFYGLNGYLLGREYFELVSLRHADLAETQALRRANRSRIFAAGAVAAFLLSIPLVNLLAPILATAAMVHIYKDLTKN